MPLNLRKEEERKILDVIFALRTMGAALDSLFFTPIRDIQVFGESAYSRFSGVSLHPILTGLIIGGTVLGSLPFIARLFQDKQIGELQRLLNQLERDYPDWGLDDDDEALAKRFDDMLALRGIYNIRSVVKAVPVRRLRYGFRQRPEKVLTFEYNSVLATLLRDNWVENKDKNILQLTNSLFTKDEIESLLSCLPLDLGVELEGGGGENLLTVLMKKPGALFRAVKSQFDQAGEGCFSPLGDEQRCQLLCKLGALEDLLHKLFIERDTEDKTALAINYGVTLEQSREEALKRLTALKASDVALGSYDMVSEYAFNFWIAFFIQDLASSQADTTKWSYLSLVLVLTLSAAVTIFQWVGVLWSKLRAKSKLKKTHFTKEHVDPTLKSKLLRTFFIQETQKQRLASVAENDKILSGNSNLAARQLAVIAQSPLKPVLTTQRADEKDLTPIERQLLLLMKEAETQSIGAWRTFKRIGSIVLSATTRHGVWVSFIGWLLGVILLAAGAAAVGTVILGNPAGIAAFVLGMAFGGLFAYKEYRRSKQDRKILAKRLERNKLKIESLLQLEQQNAALKKALLDQSKAPLIVLEPHDDRAFRRATLAKTAWVPLSTLIKKGLNRAFVAIDKLGSGVLIIRLLVLPAIAIGVGATAATGAMALAIALGFGLIWMGFNLYKYHHAKKVEAAKRLLDDLDNRITVAENQQIIYLTQLRQEDKKALLAAARSNHRIEESVDTVPSSLPQQTSRLFGVPLPAAGTVGQTSPRRSTGMPRGFHFGGGKRI